MMSRKLNLIIIDDEPLARFAFKKIIEEKFSSFQITGEAGTGPEGLSLFREKTPDIVIMDINIPDLNGLETSQIILNENPLAQIIILSAHDSFDYAQDAINIGILGYLLKPVQENHLHKLLDKAALHININESLAKEQKEYHAFRSLAIRDMVSAFIYGQKGGIPAKSYAMLISPAIQSGGFLLFRLGKDIQPNENVIEKINSYLDHLSGCFAGYWHGPLLPVFVLNQSSQAEDKEFPWNDKVDILSRDIHRKIKVITGNTLQVSRGRPMNSPNLFAQSFRQAFDALHTGNNQEFLLFNESEELKEKVLHYPTDIEKKLIQTLVQSEWGLAKEYYRDFSRWLVPPKQSTTENKFGIMELFFQIKRQREFGNNSRLSELIQTILRESDLQLDKTSQIQWFEKSMEDIIQLLDNSIPVDDHYLDKVLKYIDLNDFSQISLENAADIVGLTPQYLSRIFKARFKVNFIDYVINRRVEAACKLLENTNLPIQDIAARSGYSDTSYFRKVFHKATGFTPRNYRYSNQ